MKVSAKANASRGLAILALISGAILSGCQDSQRVPEGQATPRETLVKYASALRNRDLERYRECHLGAERYPEFFAAQFDFIVSGWKLQEKIQEEYGADAWREFTGEAPAGKVGEVRFNIKIPPHDPSWAQEVEIEVNEANDEARLRSPWSGHDEYLVLDGAWRIDIRRKLKTPEEIIATSQMYKKFSEAMQIGIDEAGDPGVTVRDLHEKMIRTAFGSQPFRIVEGE